ncbi:MAG: tetratricopeptide repeat protein [Deltaproteobacteria bacterium]|nr:tetratricopeptide repeat protein [Deltaproteobacteria bacterium]
MKKAVQYHQSGELERAREIYASILEAEPDQADALHLSGVIAHQSGRQEAAIDLITRAIAIDPGQAPFYTNLGNALTALSRLDEAIACYQKALQIAPHSAEACYNVGNAFRSQGKLEEAVKCYQKAVALAPDFPEAHTNLGHTWSAQDKFEEAVACYQRALDIRPDDSDAYNHLGMAFKGQGKWHDAASCYNMAIRLRPEDAAAYYNMGNLLHDQLKLTEALGWYQKAIQINHEYIDAYDNLGKTFRDLGMLDQATACHERSLQLDPDNAETRFDLATVRLLGGEFAEGWAGYEWRFKRRKWRSVYPFRREMPRWDGAPFPGKRLFVHSEQGFGDSLQFVRYLPMVKERGGEVVFETVAPLMELFRNLKGIDILVQGPADTSQPMDCDLYVPLLSLPKIFETRLETIPSQVPYIFADPQKVLYWQDRLRYTGFRVGLVWAGKATDRRRSCPLKELVPLLRIPGIEFIGLQKGAHAKEVFSLPKEVAFANIGEAFEDFSDTAAAIEHLDLIVSIDTSVAHLAGAMGKPVWVMLLMSPDWRWLMDRRDSPWYPTMRLFRQSRPGDWEAPVRQMERELRACINPSGKYWIEEG